MCLYLKSVEVYFWLARWIFRLLPAHTTTDLVTENKSICATGRRQRE